MYMAIPITEFDTYLISTQGEVYSLRGNIPKLLSTFKKDKYLKVTLCNEYGKKNKFVHRLVAEMFLGKSNETVDHIDGNTTNNDVSNLQWLPVKANIHKSKKSGLPLGVEKHHSKYRAVKQKNGIRKVSCDCTTPQEAFDLYNKM